MSTQARAEAINRYWQSIDANEEVAAFIAGAKWAASQQDAPPRETTNLSPVPGEVTWSSQDGVTDGAGSPVVMITKPVHPSPSVLRLAADDIDRQGTGWGKLPRSLPPLLRGLADVLAEGGPR